MEHLDYDAVDEDLTVTVQSEDGGTFCEYKVNSLLLKMLSPWWKTKLMSSGFTDYVQDSHCNIVDGNPRVVEFALNAARLSVTKSDLVSTDLEFTFRVWQLADMWQFGHLSGLCQGALQELLKDTDAETLQTFVTTALEHSNALLEDVLLPFFVTHPQERSPALYLAFDDKTMLRLAHMAPIAGFQTRSAEFLIRLETYAETCSDVELVQYLEQSLEARSKSLYRKQPFERCLLLFAKAPLPFVSDMVQLTLKTTWSKQQRDMALLTIDFSRVTSHDLLYLKTVHTRLPQEAYLYKAMWQCSQQLHSNPEVSMASSAPWAVACAKNSFISETGTVSAGPVQLTVRSANRAIFDCATPSYGIVKPTSGCQYVVRSGTTFKFQVGYLLVVCDSPNSVILAEYEWRSRCWWHLEYMEKCIAQPCQAHCMQHHRSWRFK